MTEKIFNFANEDKTIVSFSNRSTEYNKFIAIAVKELKKVQELKGNIYPSSWSDIDNLQDDMKILIACEVAIQALEQSKKD